MKLQVLWNLMLADAQDGVYKIDIFQQIIDSRGVVLAVLILLILMSLGTWFIVGYKWLVLRRARRQTEAFLKVFWGSSQIDEVCQQAQALPGSPLSRIFEAGFEEYDSVAPNLAKGDSTSGEAFDNVQRAMQRAASNEMTRLERLVPFLATTGSSAPFIGLFGTVWGIMMAFAYIHPDRPILETVTPHIAQALVATAVGLLAAIPAVMAYNYFVSKIKALASEMESFSADLMNNLRRQHL